MTTPNVLNSLATAPTTPATQPATDPLANKEVFLQLLVAQLKNQDPTQPTDGVQFVTQLAQFSGLEESTQMRADLDAILKQLTTQTSAPPTTPPAGGSLPPAGGSTSGS